MSDDGEDGGGAARRLHPGTVAVRILKQLPSTLLGLPAFLAYARGGDIWSLLLVGVALALVAALANWLQWRAFTYRFDADELLIAEGVFSKSRRSIPLSRIQDVSVEQQALQRLFGLATVKLETGGGKANEGMLDSVSLDEAHRLRDLLRRPRAAPAGADPQGATLAGDAERVVAAMPLQRVLLMGVFRFSLVWLAGIFAVLQTVDGIVDIDPERLLAWAGVAQREIRGEGGGRALLAVLALVPVALLLGIAAGVGRTVLTEYGFTLRFAPGRFRRLRGLLTRSEVVVATRRVQLVLVERGLVSGRLGWAGLRFQTLGGSDDPGGQQAMLPFGRDAEIAGILDAAGLPGLDRDALQPVAVGHVARMLIRYVALPVAIVLAVAWFQPIALLLLLALPLPTAAALLARRRHRYALLGEVLHVVRGTITTREWTVSVDKVQAVSMSQSWLQRRLGTATVHVDTAGAPGGRRPDLVDVSRPGAAALAMRLLEVKAAQAVP